MLKAEIGDFLYIIIFAILMIFGIIEKAAKAKRQQQNMPPRPPQPYDDFEEVEQQPSAPPQTLEEVLRRMMQTPETQKQKEEYADNQEKAQSLEVIPAAGRYFYHPEEIKIREQSEIEAFSLVPMEMIREKDQHEYQFDIRQAVIASEILNRKY